jgi:hypothetical protein
MGERPPAGSLEAAIHDVLGTPSGAAAAALGAVLLSVLITLRGLRRQRMASGNAFLFWLAAVNLVCIVGLAVLTPRIPDLVRERFGSARPAPGL